MTRFLLPEPAGPVEPGNPPSFSIVVAAYEAAGTIAEAVDSALAQTYPAKEIVICDDGSSDDLATALAPYEGRVTLIRQDNRGPSAARNAAIARAGGEFVVNLDADDVLLPGNLAARAELIAQRPDLDIVGTDGNVELDGVVVRQIYRWDWTFEVDDQRAAILERCFITPHWALRRSRLLAVGGFDESLTQAEDWECFIRMILSGSLAGLVDEPLARYRLQPGSLSNQTVRLTENRVRVLEKTRRAGGLSDEERAGLRALQEAEEVELGLARVRESLLERSPTARRESRRLALAPGVPAGVRLRAVFSSLFPGLARRALARRGRMTGAGVALPVD
jgi:GT2 family glycosyltransferase